jgi:predicted methyltransferase
MIALTDKDNLLTMVAGRSQLREGAAGVEEVLRIVYRAQHTAGTQPLTARALARAVRLPVPVVTAVRRELEKAGVLDPGPYLVLTADADQALTDDWGWATLPRSAPSAQSQAHDHPEGVVCPTCGGLGIAPSGGIWPALLDALQRHFAGNPGVDVTLDQSHCTPETNVRRTALMYEEGALAGKNVLVLGDDDSVSLAIALAGKALSPSGKLARRTVALDTDERILRHLAAAAAQEGVAIETVQHDVRTPLPADLKAAFDTVSTDPPYTLPGLELFLSRAVDALKPAGGRIYLHFGHRPPDEQVQVQRIIAGMGLVIERLVPGFNEYVGAGVLAGVSDLYVLSANAGSAPAITGDFTAPIYTGQLHPTLRTYACTTCGTEFTVGGDAQGRFATIEALKQAGCPTCGAHTFRLVKRTKLGE